MVPLPPWQRISLILINSRLRVLTHPRDLNNGESKLAWNNIPLKKLVDLKKRKRNHLSFSNPYSWNITPHRILDTFFQKRIPAQRSQGWAGSPGSPGESQWRQRSPPLTAACFTFLLRIFCPRPPDPRVGTPSRGSSQQQPQLCRICLVWAPNHRWLAFVGGMEIHESKVQVSSLKIKHHTICVCSKQQKEHKIPRMDIGFTKKMVQIVQIEKFDSLNCPKKKDLHTKNEILESQIFGWNSLGWRVEAQLKCQNLRWAYTNTLRPSVVRNPILLSDIFNSWWNPGSWCDLQNLRISGGPPHTRRESSKMETTS